MSRLLPKRFDCPRCGARSGTRCISDKDPSRTMTEGYHEERRRVAAGELPGVELRRATEEELPMGRLRAMLVSFCASLVFTSDERALADQLEALLRADGVDYEREHVLGDKDRVDFFVHNAVAVEIKTAGGYNSVLRQLGRYAKYDSVEVLLLITTRSDHRKMPPFLSGKPVAVHYVSFCS